MQPGIPPEHLLYFHPLEKNLNIYIYLLWSNVKSQRKWLKPETRLIWMIIQLHFKFDLMIFFSWKLKGKQIEAPANSTFSRCSSTASVSPGQCNDIIEELIHSFILCYHLNFQIYIENICGINLVGLNRITSSSSKWFENKSYPSYAQNQCITELTRPTKFNNYDQTRKSYHHLNSRACQTCKSSSQFRIRHVICTNARHAEIQQAMPVYVRNYATTKQGKMRGGLFALRKTSRRIDSNPEKKDRNQNWESQIQWSRRFHFFYQ